MSSLALFEDAGSPAREISPLLWGLITLSVVVVVLVATAVVVGIVMRTQRASDPRQVVTEESRPGLAWIYGTTAVSILALVACIAWTLVTMTSTANPAAAQGLTVDVSAAQWWWRFAYQPMTGDGPPMVTANELHIPVGVPVRLRISSSDVIHSFWIPAIGGKTDAVPGQVNEAWLEADKPGVYRGQCAEFCGQQHTQMALFVIAEPQTSYDTWREHQQSEPSIGLAPEGEALFVASCGNCHAVRGTAATGDRGPDLTHLMSRSTLAAGALPNTRGDLAGWIADPQGIKPGTKMPVVALSGPQLQSILDYLDTLA
jgi:cytochrome c oxidase subunit 2